MPFSCHFMSCAVMLSHGMSCPTMSCYVMVCPAMSYYVLLCHGMSCYVMFIAVMDSCQRGWRLLYILTAFHRCSEVLKPFLLKFLQNASLSQGVVFQGISKACEQNLRKTYRYGGRIIPPSSMELKAMVAGRSSKRQLFLFPGGIERHLKIKTCSVALDVIEELCYEMGLHRLEAVDEYAVFLVTKRGIHTHTHTTLSDCLSVCLSACLSVCLSVCLPAQVRLSIL
uniref:MyTH4 domain-containing protein n=1 Tax=Oncorhynchus kisutch TaxID=8019 RepID=A0A8C7MPJ9_ONCKI